MKVFLYTVLLFIAILATLACVINLDKSEDMGLWAGITAFATLLLYIKVQTEADKDPNYRERNGL